MSKNFPDHKNFTPLISVGVAAHNEEKDISTVLEAIIGQEGHFRISQIVVVADGCSDSTVSEAAKIQNRYSQIEIIEQPRSGKIAAINKILELSHNRLVVIANADNIPHRHCLERLLAKMSEQNRIVGPRIICRARTNLTGRICMLLWDLHHLISLENPKLGGFVLLDKTIIDRLPLNCPVDEPILEAMTKSAGFCVAYAEDAELELKAPTSFKDYFRQRRRIHLGYMKMRHLYPEYKPATFDRYLLWKSFKNKLLQQPLVAIFAALVEVVAKLFAVHDYLIKSTNHDLWVMAESSKGLVEKCRK